MFSWLLCREEMVFHSGVCGHSTRLFSWLLCREVMVFHSGACVGSTRVFSSLLCRGNGSLVQVSVGARPGCLVGCCVER